MNETAMSIVNFLATNPMFFMLLLLAIVIVGWAIIGLFIKIFKKVKFKKLTLGPVSMELEHSDLEKNNPMPTASSSPLSENDFCDEAEGDVLPITVSFENFNMMIRHCVKAAIDAASSKASLETETLAQQNRNAQALLDEVMTKVTRTYHDKKVKENIGNGDSDPYKDVSIVFFSDDFEEDFRNIVYPKLGQFFNDEVLAFADEVDLANMCKRLEYQIIQAIEDRLNLKDRYAANRQLAKESFDACKQALREALDNSLHKAKKISFTSFEAVKKSAAKKDDDLNSFIKACTQKDVKNDFISNELLEGDRDV